VNDEEEERVLLTSWKADRPLDTSPAIYIRPASVQVLLGAKRSRERYLFGEGLRIEMERSGTVDTAVLVVWTFLFCC